MLHDARRGSEKSGEPGGIVDRSDPVGEQPAVRGRLRFSKSNRSQSGDRRRDPERKQLERNRRRDIVDELVRRDDDDEALGRRRHDLLARVGAAASLYDPAVACDLVGAVHCDIEASELRARGERLDAKAQGDCHRFRLRRGRDTFDLEISGGEGAEEMPSGRSCAETDRHSVVDQRCRRFSGELLFALDFGAHVEGNPTSITVQPVGWSDWARAVEVEPSIYAADFSRLGEQLGALAEAGARVFHFDAGDGHFIPEITIGPVVLTSISPLVHAWGGVLDCHLMVEQPERHFESVANAGGDSVTFHVEACSDPAGAIAKARALGLGVGIAFSPDTPVEQAAAAAEGADLVLCMSIHPGYSGQAFMPEAAARISQLRALLPETTRVQVDGGINADTVGLARKAGADLLVAGSAVFWQDDSAGAYAALAESVAEGGS